MKFKIGDKVDVVCWGEGVIIHIDPLNIAKVLLGMGKTVYANEASMTLVTMGYGAMPLSKVMTNNWVQGATPTVKVGVGTKVVMKPTANPNDVCSEYAGSVGTILDVPTLFSEHYEIEMGAAHNFQKVWANDDQFTVDQTYEDFVTPLQEQRKKDGLCPECGEKGYFSNFAFVCTKHGEY